MYAEGDKSSILEDMENSRKPNKSELPVYSYLAADPCALDGMWTDSFFLPGELGAEIGSVSTVASLRRSIPKSSDSSDCGFGNQITDLRALSLLLLYVFVM